MGIETIFRSISVCLIQHSGPSGMQVYGLLTKGSAALGCLDLRSQRAYESDDFFTADITPLTRPNAVLSNKKKHTPGRSCASPTSSNHASSRRCVVKALGASLNDHFQF